MYYYFSVQLLYFFNCFQDFAAQFAKNKQQTKKKKKTNKKKNNKMLKLVIKKVSIH